MSGEKIERDRIVLPGSLGIVHRLSSHVMITALPLLAFRSQAVKADIRAQSLQGRVKAEASVRAYLASKSAQYASQ